MSFSNMFRPVIEMLAVSVPVYLAHETIFYLCGFYASDFVKPIISAYFYFIGYGIFMFIGLSYVKKYSFDNVGMVFLILTMLMLGIAYFLFSPILKSTYATAEFEKFNFLGIFGFFMLLDTIVAIRMLKSNA